MLLNDKKFPSSTTYFDKHAELRAIAAAVRGSRSFNPSGFLALNTFTKYISYFFGNVLAFSLQGLLFYI